MEFLGWRFWNPRVTHGPGWRAREDRLAADEAKARRAAKAARRAQTAEARRACLAAATADRADAVRIVATAVPQCPAHGDNARRKRWHPIKSVD